MTIEESIHVDFDETNSIRPRKNVLDDITDTLEDTHIHDWYSTWYGMLCSINSL